MKIFHICVFFTGLEPTVFCRKLQIEANDEADAHDRIKVLFKDLFKDAVLVEDVGGLERPIPTDGDIWVSKEEITFES